MSSLRLITSSFRANVLKSRSIISSNYAVRRSYHYAETGGNYRLCIPPPPETGLKWRAVTALQSLMWCWVFYNFWYNPEWVIGHLQFEPPDPSTFTDEELGIPPEGEDDELDL